MVACVAAACAGCSGYTAQRATAPGNAVGTAGSLEPVVWVEHDGAKCDGVADDTAAIRGAAAALPPSGGTLQFPKGVCLIHGTIYVGSHTHVLGDGTTLMAALPWNADHSAGYALMENLHYQGGTVVDSDISVRDMTFDYGNLAQLATPGGGKHALRFDFAHDILVDTNIFQVRGAEDAVAGLGVQNMKVQHNRSYAFRNCAYDFWYGPSNVTLTDNFAETDHSAQMVNFNPERTAGDSAGMVAQGLVMSGNTLVATGPVAVPIQIEPLGPHTAVQDVSVTDNHLKNVYLVMRGNVRSARVASNTISDLRGGASAIETYAHYGATANAITISDNVITNVPTIASELGVIRLEAAHSMASGNTIQGVPHAAPDLYRGAFVPR